MGVDQENDKKILFIQGAERVLDGIREVIVLLGAVSGRNPINDEYSTCTLMIKPGGDPKSDGKPRLRLLVLVADTLSVHDLPRTGRLTIGRSRSAEVPIDHLSVSRRHAELIVHGGIIELIDLGSHNGTRLGGRDLTAGKPKTLKPGDVFEVGASTLIVQHSALEPTPVTPEPRQEALKPEQKNVFFGDWLNQAWPMLDRVAAGEIPVLLRGETGAGKEVLVSLLHSRSRRARAPLVTVNCAAIPESLVESELFGHEKGAFTDAISNQAGLMERADGGILFLDEVGELPKAMQAKLLRALETKEFTRIGGSKSKKVDVRIVSATNRDLEIAVEEGTFRQDLLYRINAFSLVIPPLRERVPEIKGLAEHFIELAWEGKAGPPPVLSQDVMGVLERHGWPGNIRELRNVIEHAALLCDGPTITSRNLPPQFFGGSSSLPSRQSGLVAGESALRDAVRDAERQRIIEALKQSNGNQTKAAALLGISRRTLISRLDEYGLPRPRKGKK